MSKDVKKLIDRCLECQKASKVELVPAIIHPLQVGNIFDRVGIDLTFGFPTSANENCAILVITDYLSKYPYAVPIKSKSAEEIASKLLKFISLFGPPVNAECVFGWKTRVFQQVLLCIRVIKNAVKSQGAYWKMHYR